MAETVERAHEFAADLVELFGTELLSVVLYGSAARGDFHPGRSDLNLLVVLRELNADVLRRATPLATAWGEEGNPPPLMFSEAEWYGSADVFPIEYSDIADAHVVLHGIDPLENVRVRREHLRLQCEHQLKSSQIQLREQMMLFADEPDRLGELLLRSCSTVSTLYRTVLRIAGEEVPQTAAAVVTAVAERAGFDPEPVLAVQRARANGGSLSIGWDDEILVGYMAAIRRTAAWLDLG